MRIVDGKKVESCWKCDHMRHAFHPEIVGCVKIHIADGETRGGGVNLFDDSKWDKEDLHDTGEYKFMLGCPYK